MSTRERVAFATDDGTNITRHFGRLRGYVVVTIEDGEPRGREIVDRPAAADRGDGHRHNHSALLEPIADCRTLVAGGMGLPMANHVARSGLDLIQTSVTSIDEALVAYLSGSLAHEGELAHRPNH